MTQYFYSAMIMNIKPIALFISLAVLSGTALADAPKARHDWTGFYVGGFVGGGAGAKTNTTEPVASDGAFQLGPLSNSYHTNASVMGGGTVGYNWQLGRSPYLVGLEGEYGYLGTSGGALDPNIAAAGIGAGSNHRTKIGDSYGYGVIGGRLGYAYERSLFYVKSGAVFTTTQTMYNTVDPVDPSTVGDYSGKTNDVGHAIGGGIEQALPPEWFKLAKNISIKAEYLFLGIGRTQTSSGIFHQTANSYDGQMITTTDHISGIHTAKIGINYRFRGL